MSNVLDLKSGPEPEPQEAEPADEPVMNTSPPGASLTFGVFEAQEMAWKASIRAEALERKKGRYMMGALAAIALFTAYFTGSFLLAIIAGLTIFAWEVHHRSHDEHEVHIHKAGVRLNGHDYPFHKIHSFAIHEMPDQSRHLSLRTASRFSPHVRVPLGDADHEEVRTALAYHLDEGEHPIPLSEIFLKS